MSSHGASRGLLGYSQTQQRFPHKRVKLNEPRRVAVFRGSGNAHVTSHKAVARVSAPLDSGYLSGDHR